MLLGPVFQVELLTTARQGRYYVIRSLYGLVILLMLYVTYQANAWRLDEGGRQPSLKEMADFGRSIFEGFAGLQAAVVLILTPALVGGSIAEERQRKTLHYLLTSQLTAAEIVLGKLAARLLHVAVLVVLGLPVVSLVGLLGGVDLGLLLGAYASTFTTLYFLATASILASVDSKRPRDAVMLLYLLEALWLIVPTFVIVFLPFWGPPWSTISSWTFPVMQYVALTSPIYYFFPPASGGRGGMEVAALWGMGLQVVYGTGFAILAMMRLRPSYRKDGSTSRWARKVADLGRKRNWTSRPECGDDAMLWKEMHVARTGGLTKAVLAVLGVILLGVVAYSGFWMVIGSAEEAWREGYSSTDHHRARTDFNTYLRVIGTGLYLLWLLAVSSTAAGVLTSEREEDQWISLMATPLTGVEILRAKLVGPVWGLRWVAYLMFALWGLGLAAGAVHPLGLMACLVEFFIFTWFLTALGTSFSLRSRTSARSLAGTMAVLLLVNGGYLCCFLPFGTSTPLIAAGATPFVFAVSLLSNLDFEHLGRYSRSPETIGACVLCVLGYGLAALGLTASLFHSFDEVVDRPDRSRQPRVLGDQLKGSNPLSKELPYPGELA